MSQPQQIDPTALPAAIRDYLADSTGSDRPATIRFFADDARVDDQGETFSGREEVETWLKKTTGLFVYTLEVSEAALRDDGKYAVRNHLVSEAFPKGETYSTFVFALENDQISYLTFE